MSEFDFQSQFSMSKIIGISLFFLIEKYQFRSTFFFVFCFKFFHIFDCLLLKWCSIFEIFLPLHQFSEFINFFWVHTMLIFKQKSFYFCTPISKTRQTILPYWLGFFSHCLGSFTKLSVVFSFTGKSQYGIHGKYGLCWS